MSSHFTVVTNLRSFRLGSGVRAEEEHHWCRRTWLLHWRGALGEGCPVSQKKGCSDDDDDDVPLVLILSVSINGGSPLVGLFHGKYPHLIAG